MAQWRSKRAAAGQQRRDDLLLRAAQPGQAATHAAFQSEKVWAARQPWRRAALRKFAAGGSPLALVRVATSR